MDMAGMQGLAYHRSFGVRYPYCIFSRLGGVSAVLDIWVEVGDRIRYRVSCLLGRTVLTVLRIVRIHYARYQKVLFKVQKKKEN